jgi:hypothetical protein
MAEPIQQQIERIVPSEQFRSSEVLRRLLTFLSEKAIADEADNLNEYLVAIDGLGESSTYDPQHNSAVRIQSSFSVPRCFRSCQYSLTMVVRFVFRGIIGLPRWRWNQTAILSGLSCRESARDLLSE